MGKRGGEPGPGAGNRSLCARINSLNKAWIGKDVRGETGTTGKSRKTQAGGKGTS